MGMFAWKELTADFLWKLIHVFFPCLNQVFLIDTSVESKWCVCGCFLYLMQAVKVVASATSMKRKAIYLLALEKFGNQVSKERD